jgi:hypothetical protein
VEGGGGGGKRGRAFWALTPPTHHGRRTEDRGPYRLYVRLQRWRAGRMLNALGGPVRTRVLGSGFWFWCWCWCMTGAEDVTSGTASATTAADRSRSQEHSPAEAEGWHA